MTEFQKQLFSIFFTEPHHQFSAISYRSGWWNVDDIQRELYTRGWGGPEDRTGANIESTLLGLELRDMVEYKEEKIGVDDKTITLYRPTSYYRVI